MMKAILVGFAPMFFVAGAAHAQLIPCKTFGRADSHVPQFIHDYLDRSKGSFVQACGGGDHPQYLGASRVTKEGNICRYSVYELSLAQTDPPRLEQTKASPQTYMLMSETKCPSPELAHYTATNNVSKSVFPHLIRVWRDALSSPESFGKAFSGISNADRTSATFKRLRKQIGSGSGDHLTVAWVAEMHDWGVWTSYELDVNDPADRSRVYVVNVSRWLGRFYYISGVHAGMY